MDRQPGARRPGRRLEGAPRGREPQAIVINSGVANAATGERGELDALATAAEAGRLLDLYAEEVLVLSTGVIGTLLPLEKVLGGLRDARARALGRGRGGRRRGDPDDRHPHRRRPPSRMDGFTVGGMAKGSGMIHPQLATMLAVLTTDYPLEPGEAIDFLRPAVDRSFNSITVDGECSTNDAVCLLANGASGIERTPASDTAFALALGRVCDELAEQIVADGEGATVLAEIEVTGAVDGSQARAIAARIATSPLVKTALFGHDANWGRVLAAAGSAPHNGGFAAVDVVPRHAVLQRDDGARAGRAAPRRAGCLERHCRIELDLGLGGGAASYLTTRPLLRLRPHQRGLPHMSLVVLKVGGAVAEECGTLVLGLAQRHDVCVVHGAGPQISAELERAGLEVALRRGTARDERRRRSPSCGTRSPPSTRGSAPRSAHGRCRSSATRSASHAVQVPELGLVGSPLPRARRRSRRRLPPD